MSAKSNCTDSNCNYNCKLLVLFVQLPRYLGTWSRIRRSFRLSPRPGLGVWQWPIPRFNQLGSNHPGSRTLAPGQQISTRWSQLARNCQASGPWTRPLLLSDASKVSLYFSFVIFKLLLIRLIQACFFNIFEKTQAQKNSRVQKTQGNFCPKLNETVVRVGSP